MFFHCFGPLLPLFIFFLPCVWPCFFTVLALCYHFLYFSYLGHFDHVALTFQVVSQCNQVLEYLCYHVAHIQVCASNIKRVTATFCSAVLSSHFDHVFFTFYVSDHVFSLFWPSATIFIFFLPWSFWPCCTHFSGLLHFLRVWPCFFTVLALCYHFLYFSYLGHFDHVALTFQVFFTFDVSDHVFSLFWPSATTFYIFLTLVILTMLHSLFRLFHNAIRCLSTSATMWHIFKSHERY